jgi:hypothetical protein
LENEKLKPLNELSLNKTKQLLNSGTKRKSNKLQAHIENIKKG